MLSEGAKIYDDKTGGSIYADIAKLEAKNPDVPEAPSVSQNADGSLTVKGKAEAGSVVTVEFDLNGAQVVASSTADPTTGEYTVTSPGAVTNANQLYAVDPSGNRTPTRVLNHAPTIGGDLVKIGVEDQDAFGSITVADEDGMTDGTYFAVQQVPDHGTASMDAATGAWTYRPVGDFNGDDSFVVAITDDQGHVTLQALSLIHI